MVRAAIKASLLGRLSAVAARRRAENAALLAAGGWTIGFSFWLPPGGWLLFKYISLLLLSFVYACPLTPCLHVLLAFSIRHAFYTRLSYAPPHSANYFSPSSPSLPLSFLLGCAYVASLPEALGASLSVGTGLQKQSSPSLLSLSAFATAWGGWARLGWRELLAFAAAGVAVPLLRWRCWACLPLISLCLCLPTCLSFPSASLLSRPPLCLHFCPVASCAEDGTRRRGTAFLRLARLLFARHLPAACHATFLSAVLCAGRKRHSCWRPTYTHPAPYPLPAAMR